MRYQFQLDRRSRHPIRDRWEDAAQDAVSAGYGHWVSPTQIKLGDSAEIARIADDEQRPKQAADRKSTDA